MPAAQASSPSLLYCAIFSSAAARMGRRDLRGGEAGEVAGVNLRRFALSLMPTTPSVTGAHLYLASAAARSSFHSGANARQRSATLVTPAVARWTCAAAVSWHGGN